MKLFQLPLNTAKYLPEVLASGWTTAGPMCLRLQEKLADFLGCSPACVVLGSSATACWQGILDLLIGQGKRGTVQMTEATFVGIRQVVENTKSASWASHAPGIQVRTDIGGRRCDDPKWAAGAARVADRCHSWLLDETADFSLFSFYSTKLVPSGSEGGAVACRSTEDAAQLRLHLYCGMEPGSAGSGRPPAVCGRKASLTDVQAALALEALELAPSYIAAIEKSWGRLSDEAEGQGLPYRQQSIRPYLFQMCADGKDVQSVRGLLKDQDIPSAWNFPPSSLVTLPCFPGLGLAEAYTIVSAALKALDKATPSQEARPH